MSWPTDGDPRFVVVEVTGSSRPTAGSTAKLDGLSVHVLDRAFCHRIVASFCTDYMRGFGVPARVRKSAADRCDELNGAHSEAVAA